MLAAYKSNAFARFFTWHIDRRLKGFFGGIRMHGLQQACAACCAGPVMFITTHTAFWDALMIVWLSNRYLNVDAYCWMDGDNLRRLPFFRLLGAFGVKAGSGMDAARGMAYARRLLSGPRRVLWIFPQGRQWPLTRRPLGLMPGSAYLAQKAPDVRILPVALRYEFGESERPWVQVAFGEAVAVDGSHEAALANLLDQQEAWLSGGEADPALTSTAWASEQAETGWATRLLVAVSRWFIARQGG